MRMAKHLPLRGLSSIILYTACRIIQFRSFHSITIHVHTWTLRIQIITYRSLDTDHANKKSLPKQATI